MRKRGVTLFMVVATLAASACSHGKDGDLFFNSDGEIPPPHADGGKQWLFYRAVFSPDGNHLAIVGNASNGNATVALADSGELEPVTPVDVRALAMAWLPDSSGMVVSYVTQEPDALVLDPHWSTLHILDLDGNELAGVTPSEELEIDTTMSVTPDGSTVVASVTHPGRRSEGVHLVSIDLSSGEVSYLTDLVNGVYQYEPTVLPDGRVLFIEATGKYTGTLVRLDPATGERTRLTSDDLVVETASVRSDGSLVAFIGYPAAGSGLIERHIYILDVMTGNIAAGRPVEATGLAVHPTEPFVAADVVGVPGDLGGFVRVDISDPLDALLDVPAN